MIFTYCYIISYFVSFIDLTASVSISLIVPKNRFSTFSLILGFSPPSLSIHKYIHCIRSLVNMLLRSNYTVCNYSLLCVFTNIKYKFGKLNLYWLWFGKFVISFQCLVDICSNTINFVIATPISLRLTKYIS